MWSSMYWCNTIKKSCQVWYISCQFRLQDHVLIFFFIQAIQIDNITLWQLWYSAPEERLETWQKPFIISTSTVEAHLLSLEILDLWITDLWPCPLLLLVEGSSANSAELIKMSTCEETCETLSHKVTCLGLNVFFNKQLHHWLFQLHITSIRDEEA